MTCIVGIARDGQVLIGGDSLATAGWASIVRADPKVWADDGWLYGCCGSQRIAQLLQHAFTRPLLATDRDMGEYMTIDFVDAYRKLLRNHGALETDSGVERTGSASRVLVGHAGRLFIIHSDFQVAEAIDGYAATGSGEDIALGALYATQRLKNPRRRLVTALEAAERYNAACRGPFLILEAR